MMRITLLAATLALTAATARADVNIVDDNAKLTVDCAKEKAVNIAGNKAAITLTGTCEEVNISGNKATIKGSVAHVNVSGNENTLLLDGVDQIFVTGNKNAISYKKPAKSKKTSIANTGNENKVSQTK
jgi:hypothetical protein